MKLAIVGAGVGGLTLALELDDAGIDCEIYEAAPRLRPSASASTSCRTRRRSSPGWASKPSWPPSASRPVSRPSSTASASSSTGTGRPARRLRAPAVLDPPRRPARRPACRGDRRLGPQRRRLDHPCAASIEDENGVTLAFRSTSADARCRRLARLVIACDGIHSGCASTPPGRGPPVYSGVNMWRGSTVHPPFLTGATMTGPAGSPPASWWPTRSGTTSRSGKRARQLGGRGRAPARGPRLEQAGAARGFPGRVEVAFPWLDVPDLMRSSRTCWIPDGGPRSDPPLDPGG